jgi:hypothetical protein
MPKHHQDELPSIDIAALDRVTGGAGTDMSAMMPMMMMMRQRSAAAPAPAPPPAPITPKILLNGVEQPASALTSNGAAGSSFSTTV